MCKRVEASAFGKKGRGGMGMIAIKFKEEGDELAALTQANDGEQVLLLLTRKGPRPLAQALVLTVCRP